jgi:spoIIIJ-associated protein
MTNMEWVETTAKTIEEAKDAALESLGVDEQDAEFEVVEEPRSGLFGRLRGEARVRARVRPAQPRPKQERRGRRRPGDRSGKDGQRTGDKRAPKRSNPDRPVPDEGTPDAGQGGAGDEARSRRSRRPAPADAATSDDTTGTNSPAGGRSAGGRRRRSTPTDQAPPQEAPAMTETDLAAQGQVVQEFLEDLLDAFDADGTVQTTVVADDDAVELAVAGADLGLLIGPKGQTLQAVQELCRSVLQRQLPGQTHARLRIDVGGYRQRRKEALERFAREVAAKVVESGAATALEPMSPPDRKIVHDVVNDMDGAVTTSEGEEPRRRVVIRPA